MSIIEAQVAVACVHSRDVPEPASEDWEKILAYAQIHGVTQHLAEAVSRGDFDPPESWRRLLETQQRRNSARAVLQHRECVSLIDSLARAGVPAVPFKGTSLSKLIHGGIAVRVSSDVDILVSRSQLAAAHEVLLRSGYELADSISRMPLEELVRRSNERAYLNPRNGVVVELHWNLLEDGRACRFKTALEDVRVIDGQIATEELLIALILHGLNHHWEAMKWVVDIDGIVRNVTVDWDALFVLAGETGTLRAVQTALLLSQELFGTPLPRPIGDATAARLARRYARTLLEGQSISSPADFWMQLSSRERWIDRVRFTTSLARLKPWDQNLPRRVLRLIAHSFRRRRLAEVQQIPELERDSKSVP